MPYSYRLADEGRVLVTEYSGDLTAAELLEAQVERTKLMAGAGAVRYLLNDFSETRSLDVPMETILGHARRASAQLPTLGPELFIAFIVPPGLAHGLVRVWTAHVEENGWRTDLFRERADAEAWLRSESGLPLTFT